MNLRVFLKKTVSKNCCFGLKINKLRWYTLNTNESYSAIDDKLFRSVFQGKKFSALSKQFFKVIRNVSFYGSSTVWGERVKFA